MPFVKFTEDNRVQIAENYVLNRAYTLKTEEKDKYRYPVDGWNWVDDVNAIRSLSGYTQITNKELVEGRPVRDFRDFEPKILVAYISKEGSLECMIVSDISETIGIDVVSMVRITRDDILSVVPPPEERFITKLPGATGIRNPTPKPVDREPVIHPRN